MTTTGSAARQPPVATPEASPTAFTPTRDFFRRAFDASPVAIAIGTLAEGRHLEINPSFLRQTGYSREEIIGHSSLELGIWATPADRARIVQMLQAQQAVHEVEITIRTKLGALRRVLASVEQIDVEGVACLLTMFQDITERTQIEAALRASEERYQLITWVTTDAVWDWNLVTNEVQWSQGLRTGFGFPNEALRRHNWWQGQVHPEDIAQAEASVQAAIAGGERFWSGEYRFQRADGSYAHVLDRGYIVRDAAGKPLRMLGAMVDISERKAHEQELAVREQQYRKSLETRVEERTRELSTLLTVGREIASTLALEPLLGLILDQLKSVIPYTAASILSREGDALRGRAYRGPLPQTVVALVRGTVKNPIDERVLATRQPLIIPDLRADTPDVQALRRTAGERFALYYQGIRCWMRVPLIVKEHAVGVLTLQHAEPAYFTAHHAELALAFADQAAVAIENARLYGQAQQFAAGQERQRLARELHDSVSQALYGIALGARTARTLLDRDPQKVAEPLDYVLQLAEAGLAEMRALIFELRPESLALEGLVAALEKQAASLRVRHQIAVQTHLMPEPEVALDLKEVFYRIAQEALHNIVKHARASHVTVTLSQADNALVLAVADNGQGFDPSGEFPGHLGLKSMRERAIQLGGTLTITSAPGQGTRVDLQIPNNLGLTPAAS
ncbi:MAG: PAS domain S-box protein [Caldilinea sp. CFX5]|nr:PAS domain S-box protein [Caldilinea sp. CFX5]